MAQRAFDRGRVFDDGRPYATSLIVCSRCRETAVFVHRSNTKRMAPDGVTQWFRNKGWLVGHRPHGDVCPACITAGKRKHLRLVQEEDEMTPAKREGLNATTMLSSPAESRFLELRAEPPPLMDRDARRVITEKLDEVYVGSSYTIPWSDAKVARDLGVPQQWVANVRDAFFGPEGSNPEIDAFLEKLEPMMEEAKRLAAEAKKQGDMLNRLIEEAGKRLDTARTLVRSVSDLTGRVTDLEHLGGKLRKEASK